MFTKILPEDKLLTRIAMAAMVLLLVFCAGMVFFYDGPRQYFLLNHRHDILIYSCVIASMTLLGFSFCRHLPHWASWSYFVLLVLIVLLTGGTTMISSGIAKNVTLLHRYDTYHYLLGAKYFPELRHDLLYKCTVVADRESSKPMFKDSETIRSLIHYKSINIGKNIRYWQEDCKAAFSPDRWDEFKADIEMYKSMGDIGRFVDDMGYNGSPTHAFIMGGIANLFTLTPDTLRYATLIDMGFICIGLLALIWAAGWQAGLLAALYFFTFVGDRFYIIGNSYGRYLWIFCLIVGLALLIKRRLFFGGFAMALSAMMAVFPTVFFGGLGLLGLKKWIVERAFPKDYGRMALGALAGVVLSVILGSVSGHGLKNYENYMNKLEVHSEPLTSKRVNLRYLFLTYDKEMEDNLDIIGDRLKVYDTMKPFIMASIVLFIAIVASAVWLLVRDAADAAIIMGVTCMVTITPIVCYYFTASALLVLLFRHDMHDRLAKILLGLMFAGMAYMLWLVFDLAPEMQENSINEVVMNRGLTIYLTLSLLAITVYWFIKAPEPQLEPLPRDHQP